MVSQWDSIHAIYLSPKNRDKRNELFEGGEAVIKGRLTC